MPLKFYNYFSKELEDFKPIEAPYVGLYTCGPTVYDYVHIGNWRTFVFEDLLKRTLDYMGFNVYHVMNITDIDDKIIKRANEEKVDFREISQKYERAFFESFGKLNLIMEFDEPKEIGVRATRYYPRASEYVDKMIVLIEKLLDKKVAYKAEDGVYFSVEKFKFYGKLTGLDKRKLKKGARINDDLYDKERWSDFVLWKFKRPDEPSWPAPFGEGRPGWHIECSAMSMALLGESFDVHCGGVDLLFPHHENEIAQSEAATGKRFVNYWMEGEHLFVNDEKMSKSLGNIFTIEDVIKKGFDPLALRYLFLTAHYRSKLNFTWESLNASQNALKNLREEVGGWDEVETPWQGLSDFEVEFKNAISDDLDLPKAISIMWRMVKSDNASGQKRQSILVMDKVLGLNLDKIHKAELPEGTKELINQREEVRRSGNFEKSDKMRLDLKDMGVVVEDTPQGPKWKVVGSKSKKH